MDQSPTSQGDIAAATLVPSLILRQLVRSAKRYPLNQPSPPVHVEARWPVVVTVLLGLWLFKVLPERVNQVPAWVAYVVVIAQLVPTAIVVLTHGNAAALRTERIATLFYFSITTILTVVGLANVVQKMVSRSGEVAGLQLLASSAALWVTNVIAFSMLYWQLDRGGPERRETPGHPNPDWLFPQDGASGFARREWRPTFPDYLFLGFSTATAFSACDTAPLTIRAKMLMMLETSVSLATVILVASRAVNILGGP